MSWVDKLRRLRDGALRKEAAWCSQEVFIGKQRAAGDKREAMRAKARVLYARLRRGASVAARQGKSEFQWLLTYQGGAIANRHGKSRDPGVFMEEWLTPAYRLLYQRFKEEGLRPDFADVERECGDGVIVSVRLVIRW